jgi:hypothetical protein
MKKATEANLDKTLLGEIEITCSDLARRVKSGTSHKLVLLLSATGGGLG